MLAPRVLYFASQQIFFERREFHACEVHPYDMDYIQPRSPTFIHSRNFNFVEDVQSTLSGARYVNDDVTYHLYAGVYQNSSLTGRTVWKQFVNNYSCCDLTRGTDRLVGISGLADSLQPFMSGQYFAGL